MLWWTYHRLKMPELFLRNSTRRAACLLQPHALEVKNRGENPEILRRFPTELKKSAFEILVMDKMTFPAMETTDKPSVRRASTRSSRI